MAVPKKRTSVSRKGKRRGGQTHKMARKHPMNCPNCGDLTMPYSVCPSCGTFKGKEIFKIKVKEETEETTRDT
jgi:large subunit ribosomal protein L32